MRTRRLEALNKELHELRTLQNGNNANSQRPADTQDFNDSVIQPASEQEEDDFTLNVFSCYLKDEFVEIGVVVEAFKMYVIIQNTSACSIPGTDF